MARPLRFRRRPFDPALRGDIDDALQSGPAFASVEPRAPRRVSWLLHNGLASIPDLTARDIALFEFLATAVLNTDKERTSLGIARAYPVKSVLAMLEACGRKIETHEVEEGLVRLFGSHQKLSRRGMLTYSLPAWSHGLLSTNERYAYVNHATLARFKRRSSALLYRHILGHVAAGRVRFDPDAPPLAVTLTTETLATIVGMPSAKVHTGQLRVKYLAPALAEIAEHVTEFSVTLDEDHVGRKITAMTFRVRMLPPERLEAAAVRLIDKGDFAFLHAHPDMPAYRVAAKTLVRLGSTLTSRIVTPARAGSKPHSLLNSEIHRFHRLWLVALNEALTGVLATPGGADRPTRGASLLALIKDKGPDKAFWSWALAEAESPDLFPAMQDRFRDVAAADLARRNRWRDFKRERSNERRVGLAGERRWGKTAPATPRKLKAPTPAPIESPPPVVEGPPEPALSLAGDVGLSDDERAIALLSTPEARAEARSLYDTLQLAIDFPHRHGPTTIGRVVDRFLKDYPTLAEADALTEDLYRRSLTHLTTITKEKVPDGEQFEHFIALLGRSHLIPIMSGKVGPVLTHLEQLKAIYQRDRAAYNERRREAVKRNAGRYVKGAPRDWAQRDREIRETKSIDLSSIAEARRKGVALTSLTAADLRVDPLPADE